ncbi:alpha/beta fold hydrolase [Variovorax sp. RA8]|uniref:alpha/beta fold hydrolase n=1 Tax=Variovorax sp. (strain JCM 16519 / RA8) TaxID=662548 RepID=UPI001317C28B|nr:alpha/beta hydrolase [Variovorax sp. RA8]VTU17681.1 N-formylmaleamate deformylase [Variovorax sp. RA8]
MTDSTFLYGANLRANGIRQHYLRYGGKGRPVVVVPGITSPAVTWGFVAERFGRHFDTYVLDVRGRGLSEASASLDYALDACAADVGAFAETLGLDGYALVGHSMGARIGIRAARHHGGRLERLVLIDPPVSGPGRRAYPAKLDWYIDSIRLMRDGAGFEALRAFSPTWTDAELRLRSEWLHTCDERAIVATYDGFHQDDIHADLRHIEVPTLLIAAGRGDVIRPTDLEELQQLMPAMQVAHVPNAGHMIPWDDASGFYRAFGDFLGVPFEGETHARQ